MAELATRLGAEGPSRSSRGSRSDSSALPVAQLLQREGRPVPEVPAADPVPAAPAGDSVPSALGPCVTHPVAPASVVNRSSVRPMAPPPEHRRRPPAVPVSPPQAAVVRPPVREPEIVLPDLASLTAPLVLPPGGRLSHRRRPSARRPLAFGAAVAGAAMVVGSVASSALPDTEGRPVSSPLLDASGLLGAPVGSSGTVTLGAAAWESAPVPVSAVQPELVVPSISPPPLGERARPLNPGPITGTAPVSAAPETSSRSAALATPPVAAPADAQVPAAPPPASPQEPAEQVPSGPAEGVAGSPDSGAPDSGVPDSGTPDNGVPDNGVPDAGSPEDGSPGAGGPEDGSAPGDRTPDRSAGDSTTLATPEQGSGDQAPGDEGSVDQGSGDQAAGDQGWDDEGWGDGSGRHRR